jgi:RAB protein geranylgeranyltransferase component A
VGDIRIKRFYEWVEEWKWAAQEMEEIYSTTEKIEKILELSSVDELLKFSELSNLPLADYAYPYLLQKN